MRGRMVMISFWTRIMWATGIVWLGTVVRAADTPSGEPLPAPRPVVVEVPEPPPVVFPPRLPYERINRYEVWQYYAVDRQGRFRPRVIYGPHGSYYLYNGAPYP